MLPEMPFRNCSGSGLAGVYRGKVLQHLSHGYCKIMIHGVYPAEWEQFPENLPRAEQASPIFAGTNNGNGTFSYPNIGSTVWCMFANGDQNYPIYFAAALGGQNAYGQHELVLKPEEEVSERHLVTSGKTHIEWYENGKISAIVEDPIRTEASVVYNEEDDHLVNRNLQDKVDAEEISNMNCQTVMDNFYDRGTISSSTHLYIPTSVNQQSTLTSSQNPQAITSLTINANGTERFDNQKILNNNLLNSFDALSTLDYSYSKNTTIMPEQSTEQIVKTSNVNSENLIKTDSNNNYLVEVKHDRNIIDSYTYYNNTTKQQKLTSMQINDKFDGTLNIKDDACGGIEILSTSTYVTNNDGQTMTIDQKLNNRMQINADAGLDLLAKQDITKVSGSNQTVKRNKISFTGQNTGTAICNFQMSGYKQQSGKEVVNAKYQKKISSKDGTNDETFVDNIKRVEFSKKVSSKKGTDIEIFEDKERKVEAKNSINTSSGQLEIYIKDKKGGKSSKILMDTKGNITIEASTCITLKAPNIEIVGVTHITGKTTIDAATTIKAALTTLGDASIKGSSYTGHMHLGNHGAPTSPRIS